MSLYSGQYLDENEAPVKTSSLRKMKTKQGIVTLVVLGVIGAAIYVAWRLFR